MWQFLEIMLAWPSRASSKMLHYWRLHCIYVVTLTHFLTWLLFHFLFSTRHNLHSNFMSNSLYFNVFRIINEKPSFSSRVQFQFYFRRRATILDGNFFLVYIFCRANFTCRYRENVMRTRANWMPTNSERTVYVFVLYLFSVCSFFLHVLYFFVRIQFGRRGNFVCIYSRIFCFLEFDGESDRFVEIWNKSLTIERQNANE